MENSDYISLASAVIALSALGVAVWQGYIGRRHNILSVQPRLQIHIDTIDGLLYRLENQGLGPAIVTELKIYIGEKEIVDPIADPYPEIFAYMKVSGFNYEFHLPTKGTCYSSGTTKRLLKIEPILDQCSEETLQRMYKEIVFEIGYNCMYGDRDYRYNSA